MNDPTFIKMALNNYKNMYNKGLLNGSRYNEICTIFN
jgi:hypothetical protein